MNIHVYRKNSGEHIIVSNDTHHMLIDNDVLADYGNPGNYLYNYRTFEEQYMGSLFVTEKDKKFAPEQMEFLPEGTIVRCGPDTILIKDNGQWQDLETRKVVENQTDYHNPVLHRFGYDGKF